MKSATKIVASSFGALAGFGSLEHGVFEILQGNVRPDGIMINSMGPPCRPEQVWNACEPAMTLVPNFFVTGLLAILFGLIGIVWSIFFIGRKRGGLILILLCIAMLLVGGGIFPPLIGIIGGAVGTRINTPLTWWRKQLTGNVLGFLAMLWPWTIILFFVWLFGQWIIGYFFNDFLLKNAILIPILIIGLLVLTVFSAYACDVQKTNSEVNREYAGCL